MSRHQAPSKEMMTVIVNLKEARILEKSIQTLSLEESYASKLLDLDSKMANFNYKRLKNNVNRIRTYLKPQDVELMRTLDSEGRLLTDYPSICGSSTSKIKAAERRLKLSGYRRAASAMPRLGQRSAHKNSKTNQIDNEKESGLDLSSNRFAVDEPKFSCSRKVRPNTTIGATSSHASITRDDEPLTLNTPKPRPKTSFNIMSLLQSRKQTTKPPRTIYSCHDEKSTDSNRNVLDVFGPNPYEVRRKRLLESEDKSFQGIGDKKDLFVQRVTEFVGDHSNVTDFNPEKTQEVIESIDSMAPREATMHSDRAGKNVDRNLVDKVLYTVNPKVRDYYTVKLIRKGKQYEPTIDDLFAAIGDEDTFNA